MGKDFRVAEGFNRRARASFRISELIGLPPSMNRIDARLQIRRTETLAKIAEGVAGVLSERYSVDGVAAMKIAKAFIDQFTFAYGGANVHVPRDQTWFRVRRDEDLMRDFDGTNHEELAIKYRMLKSTIYTVIKNYRKPTEEPPRAEMTRNTVDYIQDLLMRKHGFEAKRARQAGHDVADGLARDFGGIQLVIPDDFNFGESLSDVAVLKAFTGDNHQELAAAHGLKVDQVHEVLARYRRLSVGVTA